MKECFLIDDDIDDQEIFCMALHEADSQTRCIVANNGYDCIQKLKSDLSFTPSYIFIDVNMPKMNGVDCLKELRQIERLNTSIVMMYSTSEDPKIIRLCKDLGANDFIIKPPSIESLIRILTTVFHAHQV